MKDADGDGYGDSTVTGNIQTGIDCDDNDNASTTILEDTDCDGTIDPVSVAPYPSCTTHSDCGADQFCGIECWTGGCGENEDVPSGTVEQYCQPCNECVQDGDSITGDCSMCN